LKLKHSLRNCDTCYTYLNQISPQIISDDAKLTSLKGKFHSLPEIVSILDVCEKTFQYLLYNCENFAKLDCDINLVLFNLCIEAIGSVPFENFPTCHLLNAIVKKFTNLRIFTYEKKVNQELSTTLQYGSKTANRFTLIK